MKALELQKNKHGLRVYCAKCDRDLNFDTLSSCKHGKKFQVYKAKVYLPVKGTKAIRFYTDIYEEALISAKQFKLDVKNGIHSADTNKKKEILPEETTIIEAANIFLAFKHGINVPIHLKQDLTAEYLKSIEFYLGQFIDVIRSKGYDPNNMRMTEINDEIVGYWIGKIRSHYSKGSWNGPVRILRLWMNHFIERHQWRLYNPFKDAKLVKHVNKVEAISKSEFDTLINSIGEVNSIQTLNGNTTKQKNLYRDYLKDAYKLALYTGLRREELLTLTWDDIKSIESTNEHIIITENLKVERITGQYYKKKYVPVHSDLREFLFEIGWEEKVGSKDYLICPERTAKVKTMMKDLTRAFSHFYSEVFPEKDKKTFCVLRKTYLTYMGRELGQDVVKFSSHSGKEVLDAHYFDMKLVAKGLQVKIFE